MNIVEQIFDAIVDTAQSSLGQEYTQMRRVYSPEQNDSRTAKKAFSVVHGSADYTEGVTRVYTMDHGFRLQIMNTIVERDNDSKIQEAINEMYSKADDFLRNAFLTKLGLSSVVLNVDQPNIEEPQILENGTALLVVGFNVKYRQAVNL